jgi:hypothetical protein
MLGLAKNGPEGRLHAIDLPPVFDPNDSTWTVAGKIYGLVIPERAGPAAGWCPTPIGSAWICGTATPGICCPKWSKSSIPSTCSYHASGHAYNHMMFEFQQAKRKLNRGGLAVGDDVSWKASRWDFADEFAVPSYNLKGAVGAAFF